MNNKIDRNRKDIESRNLSTVIATTSFVVILVPKSKISSIILENIHTAVEQEKEYEFFEQEINNNFYYKVHELEYNKSNNEDKNNSKFCNQIFRCVVMRIEVDKI